MKLLDTADLIHLNQAIVNAGAANRAFIENLVAPLLPSFVATLPDLEPARLTQILARLNNSGRLVDGSLPIEIALTVLHASPFAAVADLSGKLLARIACTAGLGNSAPDPVAYKATVEEAFTGPSDATLPFDFLARGAQAGRSVMKLVVPRHENGQPAIGPSGEPRRFVGTGWLIARDIVITNLHVVSARESDEPDPTGDDLALQIAATELVLDFDAPGASATPTAKVTGALTTGARGGPRDYALLRVTPLASWPAPLALRRQPPAIPKEGYAVNIVQHPAGQAKRIAIRRNLLKTATAAELQYFGDTLGGSSGSPLCNDAWEVIGLHRASGPATNVLVNGREAAAYNLGVPIGAILDDLEQAAAKVYAEIAPQILGK